MPLESDEDKDDVRDSPRLNLQSDNPPTVAPLVGPSVSDVDSGVSTIHSTSDVESTGLSNLNSESRQRPPRCIGMSANDRTASESNNPSLIEIQSKAESLAQFIVSKILGDDSSPKDEIEATLLRSVNTMVNKHEILFKGMMKRLQINDDTAYSAFITVANELFEGDKFVVTWGRIVALYAFGGQLALFCREKNLRVCGSRIPSFVGRFAKDIISTYVLRAGGWIKICEAFPSSEDMDNKVWHLLTWTALGLGLATAATFLASH